MIHQRFLFVAVFPLSIVACGGAPDTTLGNPGPAVDAAAPAIATQCDKVTTSTTVLCVENVSGHAGDVVDVPIYLIGSTACPDALEANGHFVADANSFALANPVQQVNCISRDYYGAPAPGTIEITWNAFGASSITSCPNDVMPGKVDTVKIEILPGTQPGDYSLAWTNPGIVGATQQCGIFDSSAGISGTIRVLP